MTKQMKQITIILASVIVTSFAFGQSIPQAYIDLVKKADSLYTVKEFRYSASTNSEAFKANDWKGIPNDRYNAACSWALAGVPDSAFSQLHTIATTSNVTNYGHIAADQDLTSLHYDNRWKPLLESIQQNKAKAEAKFNKPLIVQLDSIFNDDQKYRNQIGEIEKKYGWESKEMKNHWKIIIEKDSLNLINIKSILDTYGWLGAEVIGEQGNTTLFLVIQHSDQTTQEKYLPIMRDAVKNGRAQASALALLEDRVALGRGKRQLYGSQIGRDQETQLFYVRPLEDPDNVDTRRADVGLEPLEKYGKQFQIRWNPEQYKKDLPAIEAKEKMRKK